MQVVLRVEGLVVVLVLVVVLIVIEPSADADLEGILSPGTLVRVHEKLHALGGTFGWLNVAVVEGVGPVPTPDDTSAWRADMRIAITDIRSGRAVAVDHLGSPGPDAPAG